MGWEYPARSQAGAEPAPCPASTSSSPRRVALAVGRGMAGPELVSIPWRIATQKCTGWAEASGSRKGFIVKDSVGARADGSQPRPRAQEQRGALFDQAQSKPLLTS